MEIAPVTSPNTPKARLEAAKFTINLNGLELAILYRLLGRVSRTSDLTRTAASMHFEIDKEIGTQDLSDAIGNTVNLTPKAIIQFV